MLENPTESKLKKICDIAYETPAYVAALTNETASYADYEKTLISFAKNVHFMFMQETSGEGR